MKKTEYICQFTGHWSLVTGHYFYIIALLLLATACQKVVEFDIDEIPSQLVLNALPSDGNPMFVNFAQSRFFLDTNIGSPVAYPSMTLNVTGPSGTLTLHPDSTSLSNYFFPYSPQGGDSLYITIHAGESTVTSGTKIPKPLQIPSCSTLLTWTLPSSGSSSQSVLNLCIVSFSLSDYADEDNYYYITVTERDSGSWFRESLQKFDTIDTLYRNTMFMCMDNALAGSQALLSSPLVVLPQGYTVYDRLICNDKALNGSSATHSIIIPILVDTNEVRGFKHQLSFHIESIRPERVRYLLDVANATALTQMFAEPAGVFSNVKVNGEQALGLFSGISHLNFPLNTDPWPYPENLNTTAEQSSTHLPPDVVHELYLTLKQRNKK